MWSCERRKNGSADEPPREAREGGETHANVLGQRRRLGKVREVLDREGESDGLKKGGGDAEESQFRRRERKGGNG